MPQTTSATLSRRHLEMLALFEEFGSDAHLSAADVYEHLRRRVPGVGLATVHRGLARLTAAGRLMCVELPGLQASVYELSIHPHAHFVCSGCSTIRDIPHAFTEDELAHLTSLVHGSITGMMLTVQGTCTTCLDAGAHPPAVAINGDPT